MKSRVRLNKKTQLLLDDGITNDDELEDNVVAVVIMEMLQKLIAYLDGQDRLNFSDNEICQWKWKPSQTLTNG